VPDHDGPAPRGLEPGLLRGTGNHRILRHADVLSVSSTSLEQLAKNSNASTLLHATGMELGASLELDECCPWHWSGCGPPQARRRAHSGWSSRGMVRCPRAGEIGPGFWERSAMDGGSRGPASAVGAPGRPVDRRDERVGIVTCREAGATSRFHFVTTGS